MRSFGFPKPSAGAVDRWSLAGVMSLTGFFLLSNLYIASHRLFWYDEVFTTLTTRMPDWHTVWRALVEDGGDPSPMGFFIVARTFDRLFGPSEIGIRLPSALAMAAGMLFTYDCARRVTDRLHGFLAAAVLTCSYLTYYGYEGRAYALFFMFSAAALWAWLGGRSNFIIAALFLLGVQVHYYLVLSLVPFAAEEALHWRPWRRPSSRLMSAILGAAAGMLVLLPQILQSRRVGSKWWAPAAGSLVPPIYTEFFPAGLFLLSLAALWIMLNEPASPVLVKPVSSAERTAWFSLAIPLAGYVLAKLVTHAFLDRYFIGLLPGVAVGFACTLYRRFPGHRRVPVGILLLLLGYGVRAQTLTLRHIDQIEAYGPAQQRTRAVLALEEQFWSRGKRYFVIDFVDRESLLFLEARYYSKHPERYVYWLHKDPLPPPSRYYPMQTWGLDEVVKRSGEAVFVDLAPQSREALQQAGIVLTDRKAGPLALTYRN